MDKKTTRQGRKHNLKKRTQKMKMKVMKGGFVDHTCAHNPLYTSLAYLPFFNKFSIF